MKYYSCKDPQVKALVALKAIKGESISHLSITYHVNSQDIMIWKDELLKKMFVEKWMVDFFAEQSYFPGKERKKESEPF